jgi:hypothetical protein
MNENEPFFFFSVRALVARLAVFSLGMVAVVIWVCGNSIECQWESERDRDHQLRRWRYESIESCRVATVVSVQSGYRDGWELVGGLFVVIAGAKVNVWQPGAKSTTSSRCQRRGIWTWNWALQTYIELGFWGDQKRKCNGWPVARRVWVSGNLPSTDQQERIATDDAPTKVKISSITGSKTNENAQLKGSWG